MLLSGLEKIVGNAGESHGYPMRGRRRAMNGECPRHLTRDFIKIRVIGHEIRRDGHRLRIALCVLRKQPSRKR
jgi:hypothetical protein